MKRVFLISFMVVLASVLILSGCAKPAPAPAPSPAPKPAPTPVEPIKLIFATTFAEIGANSQTVLAWQKELEKRTGGRVTFKNYFASALGPNEAHWDMVVKGIADLNWNVPAATRGPFPLSELINIPFFIPSTIIGAKVYTQLFREFAQEMQAEFKGVKVIGIGVTSANFLFTTKKWGPVRKMEDLKGAKIRASGLMADALSALGGVPTGISGGFPDVYLALQKGILDGAVTGIGILKQFKLAEVTSYYTISDRATLAILPDGLVMNQAKWDSLPPDIQNIMVKELGGEGNWWAPTKQKIFDDDENAAKQYSRGLGGEFINLDPAEAQRWIDKVAPIWDKEIQAKAAKGLPAKKIFDRMQQLIKEYSK